MPELYYKDALRLGQREYRACVARGVNPCLPVMDDFIPPETSGAGIELGLVTVPAELIVGTKTRGRTNAFAANFMPIMEEGSEFSQKWERLCQAHVTEGIRDPVKVWEYMNRYYVEEGNKRVSVLKFFDAAEIHANVIRVLPERRADTEVYFEFVDFYRYSRVNFIEFTEKGGYKRLLKYLGKGPEEDWTEEERRKFRSSYYYFRKAYTAALGSKFGTAPGDALLTYLDIYGIEQFTDASLDTLKKNISKIKEELALKQEKTPIEVNTAPAEEKKTLLITKVLPKPPALKAAFLYDRSPDNIGWSYEHEQGRLQAQKALGDKVLTTAYPNVLSAGTAEAIEQAIDDGNKVIFTTSPRFMQASLKAAVNHPEAVIMNCSVNTAHRYIRTYYPRMFEAKFIIGAVAGSLSKNGKLGYVCDFPIFGQIAGINAFALGAQMVNPRARVYLEWSQLRGKYDLNELFERRNISLISSQDTQSYKSNGNPDFGLSYIRGGKPTLLMAPSANWGAYYEGILKGMLNKTLKTEYEGSKKAVNYFWGMNSGVVGLVCSEKLPAGAKRLSDFIRYSLIHEFASPFLTPIRTQDGRVIGEPGENLTIEQIMSMDYLAENIIGTIPKYDQLTPVAQDIVSTMGVEQSSKKAVGEG